MTSKLKLVTVRVTETELAQYRTYAEQHGYGDISRLIRAALDEFTNIEREPQLYEQLMRLELAQHIVTAHKSGGINQVKQVLTDNRLGASKANTLMWIRRSYQRLGEPYERGRSNGIIEPYESSSSDS